MQQHPLPFNHNRVRWLISHNLNFQINNLNIKEVPIPDNSHFAIPDYLTCFRLPTLSKCLAKSPTSNPWVVSLCCWIGLLGWGIETGKDRSVKLEALSVEFGVGIEADIELNSSWRSADARMLPVCVDLFTISSITLEPIFDLENVVLRNRQRKSDIVAGQRDPRSYKKANIVHHSRPH